MRENLKQTKNDPTNQYYAYVTRDDLVSAFGSEDVVLTIRNYDSCDSSSSDDAKRQTLRLYGRWKSIDVRLVTDEGDSMRKSINFETDMTEKEENIANTIGISSSQPVKGSDALSNVNKRRARRRKRHIVKEDDEDNDISTISTTIDGCADKPIDERLATAQTLLGFRPTRKHLKRNLDDGCR